MGVNRHGLSLGIERINNNIVMVIKAQGKLTHDDYALMTPMLDSSMAGVDKPNLKVLVDITEFEGWDLRAMWDDFKLGVKYGSDFGKIAIYGHKNWQALAAKVGSWFISGEIQTFEDIEQAIEWLNS